MTSKPIFIPARTPIVHIGSPSSSLALTLTTRQPIPICSPRNHSLPAKPIPTDSGYATQNHSTHVSPDRLPKSKLSAAIEAQRKQQEDERQASNGTPIPGHGDLFAFQLDPSQSVVDRSRSIMPEMQRLLQKHVLYQSTIHSNEGNSSSNRNESSKGRRTKRIMMTTRLMMVGKTISDAHPAIVISVGGGDKTTQDVESLINQPAMRDLYFPHQNTSAERFDVVIVGEPPRKRVCVSVTLHLEAGRGRFQPDRALVTYAGLRIQLSISERRSVIATLGGLVKVTRPNGEIQLVGMTAGHMLEELLHDEDDNVDDGEYTSNNAAAKAIDTGNALPLGDFAEDHHHKRPLGQLVYPRERDGEQDIPARDWALFDIHRQIKMKPNLVQRAGVAHKWGNGRQIGDELTLAPAESFSETESMEVVMLTRTDQPQGVKLGLLSHIPGGLMLDPEKGFVEAYILHLDHGVRVEDGDSGAWVVDPVSKAVYGHMVATDYTGAAYVVPLHATFDEIKSELGVQSVDLPTTADLLDIALRATASAPNNTSAPILGGNSTITAPIDITDQRPWQAEGTRNIWTARDFSQDRHMSELFSTSGGGGGCNKRISIFSDKDSGYGSCGSTPMARMDFGYCEKETDNDEDEYSAW